MSMFISDEAKRLLAAFAVAVRDAGSPRLSDLIELWFKENVNDPSIVSVVKADWDGYHEHQRDFDSYDVKLNKLNIAKVLNTFAVVELRWWNRLGVEEEVNNKQVLAADPELFEKIWAHVAEVDAKLACPGFSLIDAPIQPSKGSNRFFVKSDEPAYPAFKDGEN